MTEISSPDIDPRQRETPYLDAIKKHVGQEIFSFHIPGHQGGRGADSSLIDLLGVDSLRADITEVLGIDDLHHPIDQCRRAQQLAAQAWGAKETFFLVNGSTVGVQAMLLATILPEELLLVPRNAHHCLWGALVLSGAQAAVYDPPFDPDSETYRSATPDCVDRAVERHPQAKAFFLTSPTYHGSAADTVEVVKRAHRRGLLVLVDEAWGAHFKFHPDLPTSAVTAGADLVVQSTHKMLPGLTQAAMLHLCGDRIDGEKLRRVLTILQTSSPSSLLVASIDAARHQYALHGRVILERLLSLAQNLRGELNSLEGIRVWRAEPDAVASVHPWDPTRLLVTARGRGYTGYELEEYLRYEHRIQVEMSDAAGLVLVLTAGHAQPECQRLVEAFRALPAKAVSHVSVPIAVPPRPISAPFSPRRAFHGRSRQLSWDRAVGWRSAETITVYPPGIPWLLAGEEIDEANLLALKSQLRTGGRVRGAADPTLETIRVLDDSDPEQRKGNA